MWTLHKLNVNKFMDLRQSHIISVDPSLIKWWNIYGPVDFYHL